MLIEFPQHIEQQINMMAELQGKTNEQIVIELVEQQFGQRVEHPFDYDLDEMKKAMNGKFVEIPKGVADDLDTFTDWVKGAFK